MSKVGLLMTNDDQQMYQLIKNNPDPKKLQDKVWESFCLKENTQHIPRKTIVSQRHRKRFSNHPNNLKSSDGDDTSSNDDTSKKIASSPHLIKKITKSQAELLSNLKLKQTSKSRESLLDYNNKSESYDSLDEYYDVTFRQNRTNVIDKVVEKSVLDKGQFLKSLNRHVDEKKKSVLSGKGEKGKEMKMSRRNEERLSVVSVIVEDGVMDLSKDRRLKNVVQKCLNSIDDIRLLIDIGIPQPDGDEDYARRKKRAVEFSNRFSRIYLYQLNRMINDIRKLCRPQTVSSNTNILCQKFVQAFQQIHQGLQAYYNHLPTSIIIGVPEKLKDLLNHCLTICQLQHIACGKTIQDEMFNSRCKSLLDYIHDCANLSSATSLLQSHRSKLSLLGYNIPKNTIDLPKVPLKSRFSMYGGGGSYRKDSYWKNAAAAIAKKQFNVSSRYKTAKFKHRPHEDKPCSAVTTQPSLKQSQQLGPPSSAPSNGKYPLNVITTAGKKCSGSSIGSAATLALSNAKSRCVTSLNDDNIVTMVENQPDYVSEVNVLMEGGGGGGGGGTSNRNRSRMEVLSPAVPDCDQCRNNKVSGDDYDNYTERNEGRTNRTTICCEGIATGENKGREKVIVTEENEKDAGGIKEFSTGVTDEAVGNATKQGLAKRLIGLVRNSKSYSVVQEGAKNNDRVRVTSITGSKNAKLICVKDDRSLIEETPEKTPKFDAVSKPQIRLTHSETQTDLIRIPTGTSLLINKEDYNNGNNEGIDKTIKATTIVNTVAKKRNIKISRLPKARPMRRLDMLDKDYMVNVIQYKLGFHNDNRENPMYKKRNNVQPWMLTEKISDGILDHLLLSVAREIQVDDILVKLYESEFYSADVL